MKRYYQQNGHFRVSRKEDQSLAGLCRNVRYARNYPGKGIKVKMTEDRIASLDAIGFQWKSTNQTEQINSCENSQSKSDDQHGSNSQNDIRKVDTSDSVECCDDTIEDDHGEGLLTLT